MSHTSPLPGAEPFHYEGGTTGVLLCHGFTGSPNSMRPWGEHLAGAGLTVDLPCLPGHGTTWQEMARTGSDDWLATVEKSLLALADSCEAVFVMGLSMGGCLAVRLAELHPDKVVGVVLVNPSLAVQTPLLFIAPALSRIMPATKGLASDIKRPGVEEVGYDRVPLTSAHTLLKLWRATKRDLARLQAPTLVFRSPEDHVIGPRSMRILQKRANRTVITMRGCPDSYHVATLDNDAAKIFNESLAFVREHQRSGEGPQA